MSKLLEAIEALDKHWNGPPSDDSDVKYAREVPASVNAKGTTAPEPQSPDPSVRCWPWLLVREPLAVMAVVELLAYFLFTPVGDEALRVVLYSGYVVLRLVGALLWLVFKLYKAILDDRDERIIRREVEIRSRLDGCGRVTTEERSSGSRYG